MKSVVKKTKRSLFTLTLAVLTILAFSPVLTPVKTVKAAGTVVKVNPSYATIGQDGQPVPTTQPVTISIEVENVADLNSWQVVICYDNNTLYTQSDWMWLPPNHICKDKNIQPVGPTAKVDEYGYHVIFMGVSIQELGTVSGSGVLCKVNFTAVGTPGTSYLSFSKGDQGTGIGSIPGYYETYLWDSNFDYIPATAVEGSVEVKGTTVAKEPCAITISADKSLVYLGENVTISGNVTLKNGTPKANVDVTTRYRMLGETSFGDLATNKTDEQGRYNYTWTPKEQDIYPLYLRSVVYEFQASWPGGDPDKSDTINITLERVAYIVIEAPLSVPSGLPPSMADPELMSKLKPPPTPPFAVNITVVDVIDLFSWQIKLSYEPKYLELVNITLPESNVFQNKSFTWYSTSNVTEGYVFSNATLDAGQQSVNGSGTLFQIFFKGMKLTPSLGTKLSPVKGESFLKNATGHMIPFWVEEAAINVWVREEEKTKIQSDITIEVNPNVILVGQNTTITGNVTIKGGAPKANVTLTIRYKSWDFDWKNMTYHPKTDENGFYNYTFISPEEPNEFTFKVYWDGDENTTEASSQEATLIVTEKGAAGLDPQFYAIIAVMALVALTDTSVTVTYFRKTREQGKSEL